MNHLLNQVILIENKIILDPVKDKESNLRVLKEISSIKNYIDITSDLNFITGDSVSTGIIDTARLSPILKELKRLLSLEE